MALQRTTLGVSQLLTYLGVKSAQLPELDTTAYQPVLVVGDFSKTLTSEPFEGRGVCGEYIDAGIPANHVIGMELVSLAPGGCVVEEWWFGHPQDALDPYLVGSGTFDDPKFAGQPIAFTNDIGGIFPRSFCRYGVEPGGLANLSLYGIPRDARWLYVTNQRIWVPPGKFFCIASTHKEKRGGMGMVFREMPEGIGPP